MTFLKTNGQTLAYLMAINLTVVFAILLADYVPMTGYFSLNN